MRLINLCPPVILFIAFSLTQIIIDTFNNLYNLALIRFVAMTIFSVSLNILCEMGFVNVSWIFVFLPLILMTTITILVLFNTMDANSLMNIHTPPVNYNESVKKINPQNIDEDYMIDYIKCGPIKDANNINDETKCEEPENDDVNDVN